MRGARCDGSRHITASSQSVRYCHLVGRMPTPAGRDRDQADLAVAGDPADDSLESVSSYLVRR